MIIGVDAGCLGIKDERLKVGVYQVAINLFKELQGLDTKNVYYLYSFQKIDKNLLKTFGDNVKNIVVKPAKGWNKIWLPLRLLKDKPDVFLGLNQSLPLKLPTQKYKSVVMMHDLLFEDYPKLYPGSYRKLHKGSKTSALHADKIITVSEAVKTDIVNKYKIDPEKIIVAYEGVRLFPEFKTTKKEKQYFLFVGALKPQKNIPFLIEGFAKFLKTTKKDIDLIIVGGDKWKDEKIDKVCKKLPSEVISHIQFLGNVTDERLAELYTFAFAFVSPSLSEGFGLPFLEALSFGIPVIGPNTGAIPEVVGKAGILIDPKSEKALGKALKDIMGPKLHEKLRLNAISQTTKFSWRQFATIVLNALEH